MERDIAIELQYDMTVDFNSHAHVERDKILDLLSCVQPYFNSHAHVERDENRLSTPFDANISTHTLTWSVTFCGMISQ